MGLSIAFLTLLSFMLLYQFYWIGPDRLAGNDSYTHITKSELILSKDRGLKSASYPNILPFTLWGKLESDNTIPFDLFITPFIGTNYLFKTKIYISLMYALIGAIAFHLANKKIRNSILLFTVIISSFILNVGFFLKFTELRSLVLSVLFYFLTGYILFIYRRKYYLLILIAFLYTMLHTTSFLMLIPVGSIFLFEPERWKSHMKQAGFIIIGILLAVIIFPSNNFLQTFIWQPLIPFHYILADFSIDGAYEVKGDWRTPYNLLLSNGINMLIASITITIYLSKRSLKKFTASQKASLIAFLGVIFLDLFSRRFSDYMTLSGLLVFILHYQLYIKYAETLYKYLIRSKLAIGGIITFIFITIIFGSLFLYSRFLKDNLSNQNSSGEIISSSEPEPFGAGRFLNENYPNGTYVYNAAWEDFPFIFYKAREFKYAAGMEVGFMYLYDKEMLRFYQDFRAKENFELKESELIYIPEDIPFDQYISSKFNSNLIMLKKGRFEIMTQYLKDNASILGLDTVYEDPYYIIIETR